MKKILGLFIIGAFIAVSFAAPSFAGPSRALIQEMGSTIGAEEVNIDVDVVSQGLDFAAANDTTVGAGNGTIGGTGVSSVNVGLAEGYELRIGRLPGLRSYLTLPAGSPNNLGLTIKAGGFAPGLGVWLGYGSSSETDAVKGAGNSDSSMSSWRLGAAYTIPSSLVYNVAIGYGSDTSANPNTTSATSNGTTDCKCSVSSLELAGAALYPVRESLLVGLELHYDKLTVEKGISANKDLEVTALIPAIGARAIAGNWTIDAIVALISTSISNNVSGADTTTATVIGLPNLRVNYKF